MKKVIAVSLVILGIQGCSGSTPSTSDVEKALKTGVLANCPNVAVENVKLVNGLKIDDLTHQVKVQYDLKVIPLSEDKVKEIAKLKVDNDAALQAYQDQRKEIGQQIGQVTAQLKELDQRVVQQLADQGMTGYSPEASAKYEALMDQGGRKDLEAKKEELRGQYEGLQPQLAPPSSVDAVAVWGPYTCLSLAGVPPATGSDDSKAMDAITNGVVSSFEATFVMQKTDSGWMKAE